MFDLHNELLDSKVGPDGSLEFTLAVNHGGPSLRLDEWLRLLFGQEQPALQVSRRQLLVHQHGKSIDPILAARSLAGAARAGHS